MQGLKLLLIGCIIGLFAGYLASYAYQPEVQQLSAQVQGLQTEVQDAKDLLGFLRCQSQALTTGWPNQSLGSLAVLKAPPSRVEQGQQNLASQASIAISSVDFNKGAANASITVVVGNVGAIPVTVSCIAATGVPSNRGFKGWVVASVTGNSLSIQSSNAGSSWSATGLGQLMSKGATSPIKLSATTTTVNTQIFQGDRIEILVSANYGVFAAESFTVG